MPALAVVPCTTDDGPAIALNNISAFWTDPTWVLLWPGKTLDSVVSQAVRRMAHTLLIDPVHRRHEKAIDIVSGAVVGYVRWSLTEAGPQATAPWDPENLWTAARVPAVDEERRLEAEREFTAADWNYDHALDELDGPMLEIKDRLLKKKNYLLLDSLAVHPDHRRQGIATMLVESGIREAEKMGLDIFVVGMKAGLGVYQRAGFKLLDQIIQDDSRFGGKGEWGTYFLEFESSKS